MFARSPALPGDQRVERLVSRSGVIIIAGPATAITERFPFSYPQGLLTEAVQQ
jgi:hypothetical protein